MFQHIVCPYPIHMLPLRRQEESSKPFYSVILKTTTELIPIHEIESPKAFLAVVIELSLVMVPSILIQKVEVVVISRGLCRAFVIKHPKAMEGIGLPTTRVAKLSTWIVQHPIAIELVLGIKFALILGAIAEEVLSIILRAEVVGGEVAGGRIGLQWGLIDGLLVTNGRLLERVKQLYVADWSAFWLMVTTLLV
jgi:hypothetical protein